MTDNEHNPTEPTENSDITESGEAPDTTARRRRPLLIGIAAGVLGLAVGAGGALGAATAFGRDGHGSGRVGHTHDGGRHGDMHGSAAHGDGR
jgi:hypothetical protein